MLATARGRRVEGDARKAATAGSTRLALRAFRAATARCRRAVIGVWLFVTYQLLRDGPAALPPAAPRGRVAEASSTGIVCTRSSRASPAPPAVAVTGLVIAFVIGTLVAMLMSQAIWLERTLYPYAVILQTIPLVAIAPIIGLKMGFSNNSRIVICVIDLDVPDHRQHPVRAEVRDLAAARPLHVATGEPVDAAAQAAVPRRVAGDLLRPAHLRRAVGDRRDRRRVLLQGRRPVPRRASAVSSASTRASSARTS